MTQRKIALVGTATGPWISVRNMRPLSVKVSMPAGLQVQVFVTAGEHQDDTGKMLIITEPGEYPLMDGNWARVYVMGGKPDAVLCTLYSRKEDECLTQK